jgi:hypothetical protein
MARKPREEHKPPNEERERDYGGDGHRERPHGTGYGTERSAYEDYLARKWEGSDPPTPQAYARAVQLWRQLPGSIVTVPSDLGTIPDDLGSASKPPLRNGSKDPLPD